MIELAVCIALLAILSLVALPAVQVQQQRTKERDLRRALLEMRNAIDAYKRATDEGKLAKQSSDSGYPKSLDDLVGGVRVAKDSDQQNQALKFLRRVPRDPMSASDQPVQWGLRSYASAPDKPQPGDDVFDVYSLSSGIGLNGVPYREW